MHTRIAVLLAAVCTAAAACGHGGTPHGEGYATPEHIAALDQQLRAKPPLEAAQQQYRDILHGVATQIADLTPDSTWQTVQDEWTGCGGDYAHTPGKAAHFLISFSAPISDDRWPQAVDILKRGAQTLGTNHFGTTKDSAGDHDVYLQGSDGILFQLSTQKAAALSARSDCRMAQADLSAAGSTPPS
ncbi:LppA family lipoprotein [Mycolicibacterium rhodesiae]|uniref:Lipoprotein LppV n=1 Tax=Mycolicibacterium rhodesiae TaxID=36814 RepID=A0A1X0IRT2_MYCRH|nr:LppA family lipoprotein [Mycolicibacterium rhodesiae]MCV7348417.1 hypothetical protein [Mycolicibacterium rhodesiae]ORB50528.1 hypothetical protein BST42_20240 [Mycolicibacterium rhodesiae]